MARHSGREARADHAANRRASEICLTIRDDGRGLPPRPPTPARPRGMGMIGMRARARSAGGDVTVRSQPGRGCSN